MFFLIYRVWYRAEKSPVCEKKSKIAHNFFVTKSTDLKTMFLKSPWKMHAETCVTFWYLFKTNKCFFYIYFKTIKVFLWAGHEKLGYEHAFQLYTYSLGPFSRGGGAKRPPRLYIDSDPPA